MIRRHVLPYVAVLALVTLSGCDGTDRRDSAAGPASGTGTTQPLNVGSAQATSGTPSKGAGDPSSGTGGTPSPAAESGFAGHWHSAPWGDHYIMVRGKTVKIIYDHDQGRFVGTLSGSTVTGWWTEYPSRKPPSDAGEATFTLVQNPGGPSIEGVWRYGVAGSALKGWDLAWIDDEIPQA
ncbi:MAG TPA: hypothetical protein VKB69_09680, partial [Micromonosporaceae bacterium]|nr:hypothetical protein [Micromonosporaceae bacterium]